MQVRIFQPTKSVMQSADSKKRWLLEFTPLKYSKFHEPIMNWISSKDTNTQIKLWFNTKEQAIDYAKHHCLEYDITDSQPIRITPKNYANNFK